MCNKPDAMVTKNSKSDCELAQGFQRRKKIKCHPRRQTYSNNVCYFVIAISKHAGVFASKCQTVQQEYTLRSENLRKSTAIHIFYSKGAFGLVLNLS